MRNRSSRENDEQIRNLRVRLFEALAEIERDDDIIFDFKGPANPYERMYDRHGVSEKRPRRHR